MKKSKMMEHRNILIVSLREQGYGYWELSQIFNLSEDYVKKVYFETKKEIEENDK